jgi:undecaprenyl-phosphate 4-deoxy-4-formamido-L-arabinose transferase
MPISVVVPVYNSQGTIRELAARVETVLEQSGQQYELILVNDGSRDGSWKTMREVAAQYPWIQTVNLMKNYGQHNALLCGIRAARHDVIVTIDDDLQHPPEEIPRLLARLNEGFDVVYGSPVAEQHGFWRDLASRLTKIALLSTMGPAVARDVSAFRAFRTELRAAFAGYDAPYVSIDVLLTWATSRFSVVKVQHQLRAVGPSNYTFRKLAVHALNMMTGFSTWPLQAASVLGFAFTILGFILLLWVLAVYIVKGAAVPGFAFLASMIAIFSGAQMFALGIMGEYLARMHFRSMGRPAYTVRHKDSGPETGA